ncbi:hypothetical protein [Streptomyces sp. S.PB5]|uniref:hypothetical protein n=1 Tax=Streptomyces sp. S.PB5 TaxID=3020844 RepID=UPI0025B222B6|nr:hypothetical protein [Streptomyces sp. S.PB5]MDN3021616.1 hypothetical protein [Streptomyces sp. S.PB5]
MSEEWIEQLSSWLTGRGFSRSGDREIGRFGNIFIRFMGDPYEVHVVRDRGEWAIGISPAGRSPLMWPYVWRHYLDATTPDPSRLPESLEEQLDFVYRRLDEVIEATRRDAEIENHLLAINRAIIGARLGLDPDTLRRKEGGAGEGG